MSILGAEALFRKASIVWDDGDTPPVSPALLAAVGKTPTIVKWTWL